MKTKETQRTNFGAQCTPHVLVQRYRDGDWNPIEVALHEDLRLAPNTRALHYGQSIFEGLKAHRQPDGSVALFRPLDHLRRLNCSAERMCIPPIEPEPLGQAIADMVGRDAEYVPEGPGSLYVRPFVFADQADLLPSVATSYTAMVLFSPVQPYFDSSRGVRLVTETQLVRAAPGGTGNAKCAGNYAGAMFAQRRAQAAGFDEVVWLDAIERHWVEETGAMNVMFVRDGVLCTPPLTDTMIHGITRDSLLTLARDHGIPVEQRRISVAADDWREVSEVFSSGTAAGAAHVREIVHEGQTLFERAEPGPVARTLGSALDAARFGRDEDHHGWRTPCAAAQLRTPCWARG